MQIELHRTVATRPPAVFKTVADISDWMEWGIVDKVINKRPEDPAALKVV